MTVAKVITSLTWIILAIYVCIVSYKLGIGTLYNPESGFIPFLSGTVIGILGSIILYQEINKKGEGTNWGAAKWGKMGIVIVCIIGYSILLQKLGFIITTYFAMILFFKIFGMEKWLSIILYSFFSTMFIYIVFDIWLQCQFPKGILG